MSTGEGCPKPARKETDPSLATSRSASQDALHRLCGLTTYRHDSLEVNQTKESGETPLPLWRSPRRGVSPRFLRADLRIWGCHHAFPTPQGSREEERGTTLGYVCPLALMGAFSAASERADPVAALPVQKGWSPEVSNPLISFSDHR